MNRWLFLSALALWSVAASDDRTIDISVHGTRVPGLVTSGMV